MKNSPDKEWLDKVSQRLRDYSEEPDVNTWDKIVAKAATDRDAAWIPWLNRSAVLIGLLAMSWLWIGNGEGRHLTTQKEGASLVEAFATSKDKVRNTPDKIATSQDKLASAEDKVATNQNQNKDITYQNKGAASRAIQKSEAAASLENGLQQVSPVNPKNENTGRENINVDKKFTDVTLVSTMPENVANDQNATAVVQASSLLQLSPKNTDASPVPTPALMEKKIEDATKIPVTKPDSIRYSVIEKKKNTKRPFRFFAAVTPVLTYQRISPFENDQVVINRFVGKPMFSGDRLGVNLGAGLEGKIKGRFDFYSGFHFYQQSQTLTYERVANKFDGAEVYHYQANSFNSISYDVTRGSVQKTLTYSMLNAGIEAGVMYRIKGEKLKQKIGAGFLYEQGLLSAHGTYDNSASRYGFYQIFYRMEYVLQKSLSLYVQPIFSYSVTANETLSEPFALRPYRAGIGFGLIYTHGQ
jgi:hypothetical protein